MWPQDCWWCPVSLEYSKSAVIQKSGIWIISHNPLPGFDCERSLFQDGAFMVRKSSGQDAQQPYTLVVFYKGRVYNIPVRYIPTTQQYALGREKKGEEVQYMTPLFFPLTVFDHLCGLWLMTEWYFGGLINVFLLKESCLCPLSRNADLASCPGLGNVILNYRPFTCMSHLQLCSRSEVV